MSVPDRQKQRREYLRKKAGVISKSVGGQLLLFLLIPITIICFLASIGLLFLSVIFWTPGMLPSLVITCLLTIFGGYGCWKIGEIIDRCKRDERSIRYIPPVTSYMLPNEEVLVRASQEPTQEQSVVLLRAAESADTPAEQLLRAAKGEE